MCESVLTSSVCGCMWCMCECVCLCVCVCEVWELVSMASSRSFQVWKQKERCVPSLIAHQSPLMWCNALMWCVCVCVQHYHDELKRQSQTITEQRALITQQLQNKIDDEIGCSCLPLPSRWDRTPHLTVMITLASALALVLIGLILNETV